MNGRTSYISISLELPVLSGCLLKKGRSVLRKYETKVSVAVGTKAVKSDYNFVFYFFCLDVLRE